MSHVVLRNSSSAWVSDARQGAMRVDLESIRNRTRRQRGARPRPACALCRQFSPGSRASNYTARFKRLCRAKQRTGRSTLPRPTDESRPTHADRAHPESLGSRRRCSASDLLEQYIVLAHVQTKAAQIASSTCADERRRVRKPRTPTTRVGQVYATRLAIGFSRAASSCSCDACCGFPQRCRGSVATIPSRRSPFGRCVSRLALESGVSC